MCVCGREGVCVCGRVGVGGCVWEGRGGVRVHVCGIMCVRIYMVRGLFQLP